MNDRELLEAAAKAAGHGVEFDDLSGMTFMDSKFTGVLWNPLHHDGDTLRLAVKLNLWAAIRDGYQHLDSDGDLYAATRRAVVRAAAAMAPSSIYTFPAGALTQSLVDGEPSSVPASSTGREP